MEQNNAISKISNIVEVAPLGEILDVAEAIVECLPAETSAVMSKVLKILKVMLHLQPAASKTLGLVGQTIDKCNAPNTDALERMLAIAIEDGEITDAEEEMFLEKVRQVGLDEGEWRMRLHSDALKIKKTKGVQVSEADLKTLNNMINTIVEDGEITLEEEEIFFNKIRKLGLDEDEWRLKLYNDAAKIKNRV